MTETTATEPTEPTKTINRRSIVKAEQEIRDLIEVENNAIEAGQREIGNSEIWLSAWSDDKGFRWHWQR